MIGSHGGDNESLVPSMPSMPSILVKPDCTRRSCSVGHSLDPKQADLVAEKIRWAASSPKKAASADGATILVSSPSKSLPEGGESGDWWWFMPLYAISYLFIWHFRGPPDPAPEASTTGLVHCRCRRLGRNMIRCHQTWRRLALEMMGFCEENHVGNLT